jgi:hypothetical protein
MKEVIVSRDENLFFDIQEPIDFIFYKQARAKIYLLLNNIENINLNFYFKEDFAQA